MVAHADLTGASLHEPKGASTAAINTLYVADGAGSGAWSKIDSANIDTASILNTNVFFLAVRIADIGTAGNTFVPIPVNCTLNTVTTVIQGACATADTILTFANAALSVIGTITVAFTGSAAGDIDTLSASVNNTFTAGQFMRINSDGATSSTVEATVVFKFTMT